MIIMVVFLALSILLIIGTVIYLNYKKKYINKNIKQNSPQNNYPKNKSRSKKKLSNIFQIKIKDNIICLGNRYSTVIKLGNIDYNMLSNSEQETIENILVQTVLAIDYPIQFFSTTEFIDTSKVISLIKNNRTTNKRVQDYQHYLIDYLQNLMENKTISIIRNYAIISYDGLYEKAVEELNRKSISFTGNLLRAKIMCEVLNENELYDLLYRELNKNSGLSISYLKEGGKNLYVNKKQKEKKENDKHI